MDSENGGRELRADADPQTARGVQGRHQRHQRPLAPAGRYVRRRHRGPPARVGRLAHGRSRVRPHAARRRGQARDLRRSDRCAADRQGHARVVDRAVGGLPDPGRMRLGRLLLREHGVLAQRDDAESDRAPPACRVRTPVRRRRDRGRTPRAHPQDRQHSRFRGPGSQPPHRHARRGRPRQARGVPRFSPRRRAAHSERRAAGRAHVRAAGPARGRARGVR